MSDCRSEAGRLVPSSRTRDRETPVAKLSVCSRNSEDVGVSGAKLGVFGVRDQRCTIRLSWQSWFVKKTCTTAPAICDGKQNIWSWTCSKTCAWPMLISRLIRLVFFLDVRLSHLINEDYLLTYPIRLHAGFWHFWSGTPPFCRTPRHAGSSHQNGARPMEFSSCCTDRLELSSGTSALDTY